MTGNEFAAREGVNARTLAFWKWRLKRDGADAGALKPARRSDKRVPFVELVPTAPAVSAASETRAAPFEVVLPIGYRVRIAPGYERSALAELLDVLEARR